MRLRPFGIVFDGVLELGLELIIENGAIVSIGPQTGMPEPYVVSSPFVNAHSHLEYRGLHGQIKERDYWPWIREITRLKTLQSPLGVMADCVLAARENLATGVGLIGEHSDREGSAQAIHDAGLESAYFQELITFFEAESPSAKVEVVQSRRRIAEAILGQETYLAPHAPYTVDDATLRSLPRAERLSIHVAETLAERAFFQHGEGPIADFYSANGFASRKTGLSPVQYLHEIGLLSPTTQLVHCCDVDNEDLELIADSRSSIAHCPRSNAALGCPIAPIRSALERGIDVGLGMDSAASSGPIDMFDEMRTALHMAHWAGESLSGEQVWRMATRMGARTLGFEKWDVADGWSGPLIMIHCEFSDSIEDVIANGRPENVEWVNKNLELESKN